MFFKFPFVSRKNFEKLQTYNKKIELELYMACEDKNYYKELCKNISQKNKELKKENEYLNKAIKSEEIPTVVKNNPFEFIIRDSRLKRIQCCEEIEALTVEYCKREEKELACYISFFTPPTKNEIEYLSAKIKHHCKKYLEGYYKNV